MLNKDQGGTFEVFIATDLAKQSRFGKYKGNASLERRT